MSKLQICPQDSALRPAPVWNVSRTLIPQCGPARTPPTPVCSTLYRSKSVLYATVQLMLISGTNQRSLGETKCTLFTSQASEHIPQPVFNGTYKYASTMVIDSSPPRSDQIHSMIKLYNSIYAAEELCVVCIAYHNFIITISLLLQYVFHVRSSIITTVYRISIVVYSSL